MTCSVGIKISKCNVSWTWLKDLFVLCITIDGPYLDKLPSFSVAYCMCKEPKKIALFKVCEMV